MLEGREELGARETLGSGGAEQAELSEGLGRLAGEGVEAGI